MKLLGLKKCTLLLCVSCGIAVIILSTRKPLQLNDVWIPFPVFSNVSGHVQQVTPRNAAPSSTSTCGAMFDQKKWKTPYQVWSTNGYIRYNWAQEKHDFNTMPTKIVLNMSIDSSQTFIKEAFLSHHPNIRYNKSSLSKYQLTVPDCQIGEWHSSVKIFQECLSNRLVKRGRPFRILYAGDSRTRHKFYATYMWATNVTNFTIQVRYEHEERWQIHSDLSSYSKSTKMKRADVKLLSPTLEILFQWDYWFDRLNEEYIQSHQPFDVLIVGSGAWFPYRHQVFPIRENQPLSNGTKFFKTVIQRVKPQLESAAANGSLVIMLRLPASRKDFRFNPHLHEMDNILVDAFDGTNVLMWRTTWLVWYMWYARSSLKQNDGVHLGPRFMHSFDENLPFTNIVFAAMCNSYRQSAQNSSVEYCTCF